MTDATSNVFLTKLVFGTRISTYDLHRELLRFVPKEPRYLFRAEVERDEDTLRTRSVVLLQSIGSPVFGDSPGVVSHDSRALPLTFEQGRLMRFFLRANVTRATKFDREGFEAMRRGERQPEESWRARRGKRVAVYGEEAQRDWLARQGIRAGFSIATQQLAARDEPELVLSKTRPHGWSAKGNTAQHDGVDYQGILRVDDAAKLRAAVMSGIGPAKAFGFGLLSLKALA